MHRFGRRSAAVAAGIVFAGLSLLGGITAAPASAASTGNSNPNNYLALGDSVALATTHCLSRRA